MDHKESRFGGFGGFDVADLCFFLSFGTGNISAAMLP
jgi:hypothetical protein